MPLTGQPWLANTGWQPKRPFTGAVASYFKRNLAHHVAAFEQWERLSEMLADGRSNLFQQWIEQGDLETGRFCLGNYIVHLQKLKDPTICQHALATQLARLEVRAGNLLDASQLLGEVLAAIKASEHPSLFAIAAHEYGSICLEQGENVQARNWYRRALKAARRQHPVSNREIAANLVALATSYHVEQRFARRVKRLAQSALSFARLADDASHEVEALRILADVCKDALQYREAKEFLSQGLDKARQKQLVYAEMALLTAQGWMQYQRAALHLEEIAQAVIVFDQLAAIANHFRHMRFLADAWSGLGQCALLTHDATGIARAIQELQRLSGNGVPLHVKTRLMLLQAGLMLQDGALAAAAMKYKIALDTAAVARLPQRQAEAHVGYGAVLWRLRETTAARHQWVAAIALARTCTQIRKRLTAAAIRAARNNVVTAPL